jgi:hypothetical protein
MPHLKRHAYFVIGPLMPYGRGCRTHLEAIELVNKLDFQYKAFVHTWGSTSKLPPPSTPETGAGR